jgi:hypothetical protein
MVGVRMTMPNPNYRVEHVAEAPRGWRVRTKMMATHMLRIAFPPGRKRGGGKVIEIYHPANENPCALHKRAEAGVFGAKAGRNPVGLEHATQLYEKFHGTSPEEIVRVQESDCQRKVYTGLGTLTEIVIDAVAGEVKITFPAEDGVQLASAPGGRQLYLIGGNQNIDAQIDRFGTDTTKDFVELGAAVKITYRTRKSIDNFDLVDYWHKAGEETNEPPYAFYDHLRKRIFLVGGRYRVEAPGIIN